MFFADSSLQHFFLLLKISFCSFVIPVTMSKLLVVDVRDGFTKKVIALLDFVQMKVGGLPKFLVTFLKVHFWSLELVYFIQIANNLNFKLFF